MKLEMSSEGRYALRTLVYLARVGERVTADRISAEAHIPRRLLARILAKLSHAGLVESEQGRGGGSRLARPANKITLREAVETVEGPFGVARCIMEDRACGEGAPCAMHDAWVEGQQAILTGAVAGIVEVGLPLWHLAFLNPGMAHARNLGETFCFSGPIRQNGPEKSRAASEALSHPLGVAPSPRLRPTVRGGRGSFRSRPLFYPQGFLLYPAIWSRWWTSLRSLARWRTVPGSPPSRAPSPGLERCCS